MAIFQNAILVKCQSPKSLLLDLSMILSETFRIDVNIDLCFREDNMFFRVVYTHVELIAHLECESQKLKSDMIEKQERVIELQDEMITSKDNQLVELIVSLHQLVTLFRHS